MASSSVLYLQLPSKQQSCLYGTSPGQQGCYGSENHLFPRISILLRHKTMSHQKLDEPEGHGEHLGHVKRSEPGALSRGRARYRQSMIMVFVAACTTSKQGLDTLTNYFEASVRRAILLTDSRIPDIVGTWSKGSVKRRKGSYLPRKEWSGLLFRGCNYQSKKGRW